MFLQEAGKLDPTGYSYYLAEVSRDTSFDQVPALVPVPPELALVIQQIRESISIDIRSIQDLLPGARLFGQPLSKHSELRFAFCSLD